MKEISVVIPVYNEAGNLRELAGKLDVSLGMLGKSYECIFIDDGSVDDSLDVLRDIRRKYAWARIIRLKRNFGQTAAMAAGFDHAEGDIIITMDADLQNDPEDIPLLLARLNEGYDIVSGWRMKRKDRFFRRKLPSFVANRVISFLTGVRLNDFGCTLKAYRKQAIKDIRLYGEMHRFIPAIASGAGIKIAEMRVRHHNRKYGVSKYGVSRTLKVMFDMMTVKFFLSFSTSPMQIFGFVGMLSVLAGMLALVITILLKVGRGVDMTGNPLFYLTIVCTLIGVQFVFMGFLGEIVTRTYHETQSKHIYNIESIEG